MKTCSFCGKQYPDEAMFCVADGKALVSGIAQVATASPTFQQRKDVGHIQLLSIFHFVLAGFAFLGLIFVFLHYLIMSMVMSQPSVMRVQNGSVSPDAFFDFFRIFYFLFGVALVAVAALNVLSGIFLRQKKHRMFSIVVSCLNCLQIPFGTALGIFTIVVLSRSSVKEVYPVE
jgi:hypothetical protein